MAKLIYAAIASLDGYVNDAGGGFDWAAPDPEVHAFFNDLDRTVGTHLYGRRMYEVMRVWESMPTAPDGSDRSDEWAVEADYAQVWRNADKIVYSTTLPDVEGTARTRLERSFDAEVVRRLKAEAGADLSVGGPGLAAEAFRAGLVDECHLVLSPVVVGGGTAALPAGVFIGLELLDLRRFGNGVVHLHYRVR